MQAHVTFRDVAVCFSEEEWGDLADLQKLLYQNVMEEIHAALHTLGYAIANPGILFMIRKESELYVPVHPDREQRKALKDVVTAGTPDIIPDIVLRIKIEEEPLCNGGQASEGKLPDGSPSSDVGSMNIKMEIQPEESMDKVTTVVAGSESERNHSLQHSEGGLTTKRETMPKQKSGNVNGLREIIPIFQQKDYNIGQPSTCTEKSLSRNSNLIDQLKMHTMETPFIDCHTHFSRNPHLIDHLRIQSMDKPYICLECGKSFGLSSNLIAHQRTHTGERPYKCTECGKSFSQSSSLINHRRTHTGERPYICTECGKSFNHISNYYSHRRTHTGERPYKCSECQKSFSRNSNLVKHLGIHRREKPFKCSECGKSFSQSSSFIKHRRTHTDGERTLQSPECGKNFSENTQLKPHKLIIPGERQSHYNSQNGFTLESWPIANQIPHTGWSE